MKREEMTYRTMRTWGLGWLMRLGLLLAAVVLTAGCSSGSGDDPDTPGPVTPTPDPTPEPGTVTAIAFSAHQEDEKEVTQGSSTAQTRAVGLEEKVRSFKVWGYKNMSYAEVSGYGDGQSVIPGYLVNWVRNTAYTTTSNTNDWEYVNQQTSGEEQTIKYWDWSATAYRFYAVAAVENGLEWTWNANTPNEFTLSDFDVRTQTEVAPYFSHLWFSTGNPTDFPTRLFGRPVQLEFLKPFAKVRIMFVAADQTVELADLISDTPEFKFRPNTSGKEIAVKGSFTVTYPLTGTGTTETWTVSAADNGTIDAFKPDNYDDGKYWYRVLPAKASDQGVYKLTIVVNNEEKPCYVPAEYMEWQPGYSYTYIFKIVDEGGVEFGGVYTAYTDWQTGKEADYTIYNW